MRAIASAILLSLMFAACGSKGALILPPENTGTQQDRADKKN